MKRQITKIKLSVNASKVLSRRYLLKDSEGNVTETPAQLFRRVAKAIAAPDMRYDPSAGIQATEDEFYRAMANLEFLPNSPTLMNAGTSLGQLAACFVIPVNDSIPDIFDAVKYMAIIHQTGGGTGFSFSRLRPKGDLVKSTKGVASGPISFMRVFDIGTDVIKQGGRRRGANMGILRSDHPDIIEFIAAKRDEGVFRNFNLSVAATDVFMEAVARNEPVSLVNPRTGEEHKRLSARSLFDLIVANAWSTGDPGLFFIDRANQANPTPKIGSFEAANPCGEVPLLPYEACNLGSVNLTKMLRDGTIDWNKLRESVHTGIHFLDNVIDAGTYPLPQIDAMAKGNRKVGLGVMGFAEMLLELGIPYDSEEALATGEHVMKFIRDEAVAASVALGHKWGSFPNFGESTRASDGHKAMRNATVTAIAPTGTISIIAGATSGIEPIFAIAYARNIMEGTTLLEVDPVFERVAKQRGFYSRELMMEISKQGSIQGIEQIPEDVRRLFVTAFDIAPEWHVRMQAAFQKYVDNAVSKTVNLPENATLEDVKNIYILAYELGCKGITVYRYGSKKEQVLYIGKPAERKIIATPVTASSEYSGGSCASDCCPL
ncbi:MAG TPA: adenosylcobalamin-dependent ribonucleoside-diphosphate reductase [Candidatus Aquicultor sp.]|jgi:ribonucleoside-diphosphate reductase alpha chain